MLVAEREADKVSERRRRRERKRARSGGYWGRRPFGYDKVRDEDRQPTGALTIVQDEAGLIREAAARLITEAAVHPERSPSVHAIAREWDDAGVTTAYGGRWSGMELARLLRSRLYAPHPDDPGRGIRTHREGTITGQTNRRQIRGIEYPGQWPPILDADTHERVTAILADPRRKTKAGGGGRPARYVLTGGLAVCGKCGTGMHAARYAHDRSRRVLKCPSAPQGCGGVHRGMEPVEAYVREVVFWWLRKGGEYDAYRAALRKTGAAWR